jgi:lipid-A-disaccharide synthase
LEGQNLEALAAADLAITKSGTVNLELALLGIPQVVIYKVNPLTIWIARHILNFSIPFMSPANLVLMSEIVPEFLQEKAKVENIVTESLNLLFNEESKQKMQLKYQQLRAALGEGKGKITELTAKEIINFTQNHLINKK